jgi:hypothetical protein
MKVALLLTGQLRTYSLCKYIVKHCIIDRYDTDVFMSIDVPNNQQNEYRTSSEDTSENDVLAAISWYQPVKYVVTRELDYSLADAMHDKLYGFVSRWRLRLLFVQYANVKKAYQLLQEHGTNYDLVIRLRFDQLLWNADKTILHESLEKRTPFTQVFDVVYDEVNTDIVRALSKRFTLDLDEPAENTAHVFGYDIVHGYPIVNDQFFSHGPDLIDVFARFHDEMPSLFEECSTTFFPDRGALIEHIFYKFLFRYRINVRKSVLIGEFVREL